MNEQIFSDEVLNAYVDGQLDPEQRLRVIEAARHDERLAARVCELRQLKEMVQVAFASPPHPAVRERRRGAAGWLGMGAAALVMLALGSTAGWLAHGRLHGLETEGFELAHLPGAPKRVILHVSTGDPARLDDALSNAELLLTRYRAAKQPLMVEVVANGEGLALLNADTSPYGRRIRALAERFDNISFMACAQALERMQLKGIQVRMVPEAKVLQNGALDEIITRLQEGWAYIRV